MPNNKICSSFETLLTQRRHTEDSGQQRSECHNSKCMFEGHFRFNNVFLQIRTNNKQLCINTLIAAIIYINHCR
jgi:hypothetical protein